MIIAEVHSDIEKHLSQSVAVCGTCWPLVDLLVTTTTAIENIRGAIAAASHEYIYWSVRKRNQISIFITKIQGQGKVIGILTMQFGEVTITSSVLFQRQSSINLNTINTRILDICLFIKTEWKDIKERMKTIVKRSLVWLYKILNVRMINEEARENLLNGDWKILQSFSCIVLQISEEFSNHHSTCST